VASHSDDSASTGILKCARERQSPDWRFSPRHSGEWRSQAIKRLEVNDLNFELAFPECIGQDESGEKGF
jgi:hypothetical protein